MSDLSENSKGARALAAALEPFAGQVYFSPECHKGYEGLGFPPSSGNLGGVEMPEMAAYFTSRGSVMGQVPGEVVAAAFGVFNPTIVVPAVATGWSRTDATTIESARTDGAIDQLHRILGAKPDGLDEASGLLERVTDTLAPAGKPLFAGLQSQAVPEDPLGAAWRMADMLREYRGDAHVAAWTTAGFDGCEISLFTEPYWGLPLRTYSRSRAWSDEEFDAAEARLVERGLLVDGAFTDEGRAAREAIEVATDDACRPIVDALGDGLSTLVEILGSWSKAIRDQHGYPATGPVEMAEALRRR